MFSGPPDTATATVAVAVFEPAVLVAVRVYVVVAFGLTFVVPLADVDANVPGVIVMLVAPEVAQLSVLTPPGAIVEGLAVNELIDGALVPVPVTVTFAVAVAEPAAFVAVSVYVVVADGLKDVEPVAEVDAKLPGVMVTLVAPEVAQLSVVSVPEVMLAGLAEKDAMVGAGVCVTVPVDAPFPQPTGPPQVERSKTNPQMPVFGQTDEASQSHLLEFDSNESMRNPSVAGLAGIIEGHHSRTGSNFG
jgi:hypothetical protein